MADREPTTESTTVSGAKRKRPWLRRVGVVVGCLFVGAVINVLVAWGISIGRSAGVPSVPSSSGVAETSLREYINEPSNDTTRVSSLRGTGWWEDQVRTKLNDGGGAVNTTWSRYVTIQQLSTGWPWLSMKYARIDELRTLEQDADGFSLPLASQQLENSRAIHGVAIGERHLPLRPLIRGTILNSLLYAFAIFVLFAAMRTGVRLLQVHRGHCPDCGYDLRGADHGKCPECGEAVSR